MNKLRKIRNHFYHHRAKYILTLSVIALVVLYQRKEYWHNNAKTLGHDLNDAEDFVDIHNLFDNYTEYINEIRP
jgi:hypothetical protein